MCKRPDVATEVTLLPVKQFAVDAAILFADILLVLEPLGIGFEFTAGDGPQIQQPVRTRAAIDAVASDIDVQSSLGFVMQTVRQVRAELPQGCR